MNARVIPLVGGALLVSALALTASCKPPKIHWADPPPPQQKVARTVPAPVVAPVVKRNLLPPDGQIMRDLQARVNCEAFQLQEPIKNLTIKSKQLDPYEKDQCNVIAEGKLSMSGERIRYAVVYQSRGDFWKLRGIDSRSVRGGYTIANCP